MNAFFLFATSIVVHRFVSYQIVKRSKENVNSSLLNETYQSNEPFMDPTSPVNKDVNSDLVTIKNSLICEVELSSCEECDKQLIETVRSYHRHIIICFGSPEEWPANFEKISNKDNFPINIIHHLDNSAAKLIDIKITVSGLAEGQIQNDNHTEIFVYPDNLMLIINSKQVNEFVDLISKESFLIKHAELLQKFTWNKIPFQKLILVCNHGNRDKRCFKAGNQVINLLKEKLNDMGISNSEVALGTSSHIGVHAFAGVLIVYPSGVWYGKVHKGNAGELLINVLNDKTMYKCLRGLGINKNVLGW